MEPIVKGIASRLSAENLDKWMNIDEGALTVHHYTDSEIVKMVVNLDNNWIYI